MASWIVCPGCTLKHSARPDGLCPRCRRPVAAAAPSAPAPAGAVPAPADAAPPPVAPAPVAAREPAPAAEGAPVPGDAAAAPGRVAIAPLAGASPLRLAGAALLLVGATGVVLLGTQGGGDPEAIVLAIVDLVLGAALVAGLAHRPLVVATAVRGGAAAALGVAALALHRGAGVVAANLLLAAGLGLVVLGRTRAHALAGLAAAGLAVVANAAAVATAIAAPAQDTLSASFGPALTRLASETPPSWRVDLPGRRWRARPAEPVRALPYGHVAAATVEDAAIIWPAKQAEIVVIAQTPADLQEGGPALSGAIELLVREVGSRVPYFEPLGPPAPFGSGYEASFVRATGEIAGRKTAFLFAVFAFDDGAVNLVGRCPAEHAADVQDDFLAIARSLKRGAGW